MYQINIINTGILFISAVYDEYSAILSFNVLFRTAVLVKITNALSGLFWGKEAEVHKAPFYRSRPSNSTPLLTNKIPYPLAKIYFHNNKIFGSHPPS